MRHWSYGYLGRSFACWPLVREVYAEQRGIALPAYEGPVSGAEAQEIAVALGGTGDWPWETVDRRAAREFDLVTFRIAGVEAHVGLMAGTDLFLHAGEGITSRLDRLSAEHWRALTCRFLRYRDPSHV